MKANRHALLKEVLQFSMNNRALIVDERGTETSPGPSMHTAITVHTSAAADRLVDRFYWKVTLVHWSMLSSLVVLVKLKWNYLTAVNIESLCHDCPKTGEFLMTSWKRVLKKYKHFDLGKKLQNHN